MPKALKISLNQHEQCPRPTPTQEKHHACEVKPITPPIMIGMRFEIDDPYYWRSPVLFDNDVTSVDVYHVEKAGLSFPWQQQRLFGIDFRP